MPEGYETTRGPSIIEMIWTELDASYTELMRMERPKAGKPVTNPKFLKLQGICAGLASAIAIINNPYNPDDDAVRVEADERYRS